MRKDLALLAEQGLVIRTHGGAAAAEDRAHSTPVEQRRTQHVGRKKAIARAAIDLIADAETIYVDSGSTCREVAALLGEFERIVVTNSLDVMNQLAGGSRAAVHCVGGSLRSRAGSLLGPVAQAALAAMQIDVALLGASGLSLDGTFSAQNVLESALKRVAIAQAVRTVALVDRSKIGVAAFSVFAHAADVDVVVTDCSGEQARALRDAGIEVVRVAQEKE